MTNVDITAAGFYSHGVFIQGGEYPLAATNSEVLANVFKAALVEEKWLGPVFEVRPLC